MVESLPKHLTDLLTPQVFEFAASAAHRYGTSDLVVILDLTVLHPELDAVRRPEAQAMFAPADELHAKLGRPAAEVAQALRAPQRSFWFLVIDDDVHYCVALNGSMLAADGTA